MCLVCLGSLWFSQGRDVVCRHKGWKEGDPIVEGRAPRSGGCSPAQIDRRASMSGCFRGIGNQKAESNSGSSMFICLFQFLPACSSMLEFLNHMPYAKKGSTLMYWIVYCVHRTLHPTCLKPIWAKSAAAAFQSTPAQSAPSKLWPQRPLRTRHKRSPRSASRGMYKSCQPGWRTRHLGKHGKTRKKRWI